MVSRNTLKFSDCEWAIRCLLSIIEDVNSKFFIEDDPNAYFYILEESHKILSYLEEMEGISLSGADLSGADLDKAKSEDI
jgi:hypothetical protein